MIKEVSATGFKSLNGFKIRLEKGLNILVGPNGSGKTNIISLFEFLSNIAQHDLPLAVRLSGGAGSIFRKIGVDTFSNSINIKIKGSSKINQTKYFNYLYEFTICVNKEKSLIHFSKQQIIGNIKNEPKTISSKSVDYDLNIIHDIENISSLKISIIKIDRRKYKSYIYEKVPSNDELQLILKRTRDNSPRSLVQQLYRYISHIGLIFDDMLGGETFNIIPSKVKLPEDIGNEAGINKDGTGLASTLYYIKNNKYLIKRNSFKSLYRNRIRIDPKTYERIEKLTNLANSSISKIEVDNNPFVNQLQVKIHIIEGDEKIILPLSSMSDGTIKWITLITAILTSTHIFSIEEPENYLHPWMQAQIVEIMRSKYASKNENSFVIMSTHSETLLNHSKPNEVIIVKLINGVTSAERVNNVKKINEEISKTGFGLGYYYITGGIENE